MLQEERAPDCDRYNEGPQAAPDLFTFVECQRLEVIAHKGIVRRADICSLHVKLLSVHLRRAGHPVTRDAR